ncbi:TetR/AcrR family transcriptional regulator [Thalassotalea sp. SU-HH00458]|uniref:TetR/AcrR family transcriptional regulator n=1 Tax=Thalassotalea sp. SU-HH00458 TaxID=3127657 RepID=UPI00310C5902
MAWHKHHKKQSKDKILTSAADLFTRYGFEKVSINQVMENAKLTRGAFYAHFASKSELYAQAITKAGILASNDHLSHCDGSLMGITKRYLSGEHRNETVKHLCPLAFLVTDINQQNKTVKDTYTNIFKGFVDNTNQQIKCDQKALQVATLMIGGLALSKAINDPVLSDKLLIACQEGIANLINANIS